MAQERRLKRRHLIYYLRVFDHDTGALLGHLVDVTAEGMMLVCEAPIREGATFSCTMGMPSAAQAPLTMSFAARCVWCKKDLNPDFYAAGFKIDNMSQPDLDSLANLVETFGFQD